MLPLQILLNNFLYDLCQVPLPSDHVDDTYTVKPKRWNVGFIRRFMLLIGPLSSIYDFLTFWIMLGVFHADERLFRTGWFVESLATQTLVIFVIRTTGPSWESRPSAGLAGGVCACVAVGTLLPFTPVAPWLAGFHAATPTLLRHSRADDLDLPRSRRRREALVLSTVTDVISEGPMIDRTRVLGG